MSTGPDASGITDALAKALQAAQDSQRAQEEADRWRHDGKARVRGR